MLQKILKKVIIKDHKSPFIKLKRIDFIICTIQLYTNMPSMPYITSHHPSNVVTSPLPEKEMNASTWVRE